MNPEPEIHTRSCQEAHALLILVDLAFKMEGNHSAKPCENTSVCMFEPGGRFRVCRGIVFVSAELSRMGVCNTARPHA